MPVLNALVYQCLVVLRHAYIIFFCSIVHCYPTRQLVRFKLVIVHNANANSFSLATTTAKAITRDLFRGRVLPFLLFLSFLSSPPHFLFISTLFSPP